MFDDWEEILPGVQHNSFIVPVPAEQQYEFVDPKERQTYGGFHYEFYFDEDGNCIVQKHASRVLANNR